ncbi:MAG: PD-(D/E)XK nuclease family protein [Thermoanaerobaculia bacterium]
MACERLLLADLDDHLRHAGDEILTQPILIVVPSKSLRLHLLDRITDHRGGASAGIQCLTLHAAAMDIACRVAPLEAPRADLLPMLARRFASREPSLRRSLGHLHDSYASVLPPVEDLLEAGFDPALGEALEEVLEKEGPERASNEEVERARALIRVASCCAETLSQEGAPRVPDLLRHATDQIRRDPDCLQAGTVMIYGFADATGLATDLIQVLLEKHAATIYLDQPADPANLSQADEGAEFGRRFTERIALATFPSEAAPTHHPPASIEMARALGGQAEIRHIANRIRQLLDDGARPEGIGVVARQLDSYVSVLRTHFWRQGVPFSAIGAVGPLTESGRRVRAVLDLLKQGRMAPIERWLDASPAWTDSLEFDLRLALYGFGAARVEEAADLDLEGGAEGRNFPLPVRAGLTASGDGEDAAEQTIEHRSIPGVVLVQARDEALRLCKRLDKWQQVEQLEGHLTLLRAFLLEDLQWPADGDLAHHLIRPLERLREQTRADLPLAFDEMVRWLETAWSEIGRDSLGGRGSGVQVLDVTEARGRTFEHLFVIGLNRGAFPRQVREDPLLPDFLRQLLSREGYGVLPDLARKLSGFAEERFLFAQLLASSPLVALSWQVVDDDGQALSVSPLVERMRWSEAAMDRQEWREPPTVPPLFKLSREIDSESPKVPRLAYEHAVHAAMSGPRTELGGFLSVAITESVETPFDWKSIASEADVPTVSDPDRWATARIRLLDEMDPIRGDSEGERTFGRLGPFLGFVGPILDEQDLRSGRRLFVTALEGLAACSWQTFLSRLLRLEALPDPLEILPGISPVLVGDVVHRCLERLVGAQLPTRAAELETARTVNPQSVTWPANHELDRLLEKQAELVARRHGIGMRGFPKMLARVARPYLDCAHEMDWASQTGIPVAAVEVEGQLPLRLANGSEHVLFFRADRLDVDDGGERLVDYKTGKNDISSARTAATRQKNLIRRIRAGKSLQAVAYAQAASSQSSSGRYLFLKPDLDGPDEARDIGIESGNEEARLAFQRAASGLLEAWNQGSFLPRLVEADRDSAPRRCGFCQVAEACLRYDSGARGRLRTWMAEHQEAYIGEPDRASGAESAAIEVWLLDSKRLGELDATAPTESGDP